ncbi:MAG TPA: UDP-N-acetylglucosamine 2-epimerase (non-hydrolyzing) [Polyangiaceae bacterium]
MSAPATIAVVLGTRPEAIKLAPVVREIARRSQLAPLVVSTGQHREMLEQALRLFDLRPDVDLDLMRPGQTLHDVTSDALLGLRTVLRQSAPRYVVVQGDTTTALAAALAAFYEKIPVAHVEAGLRSGQRYAPFPEEMNRRLVDQLSSLLFAPTEMARTFLLREGFSAASTLVTGNTVVDALHVARDHVRRAPPIIAGLSEGALDGKKTILVTAHRRESFGEAFAAMCRALRRIVDESPDASIVYPVHLNPNVDGPVRALLGGHERIHLLKPVTYLEFVALMDRSWVVLTDSGGVQEEAPTFGKPVLVLRDVTERPDGIEAGVARLVGTSETGIVSGTLSLLRDPAAYAAMARPVNPYGDGHASERIVDALARALDLATPSRRMASQATGWGTA